MNNVLKWEKQAKKLKRHLFDNLDYMKMNMYNIYDYKELGGRADKNS
jgi:hypothetical protein